MDGDKKGKIFQQTSQAGKLRGRNSETLIHKHEIISPRYCAALLYDDGSSNCENGKANYEKVESYIIFISNEINKFYYFNDS